MQNSVVQKLCKFYKKRDQKRLVKKPDKSFFGIINMRGVDIEDVLCHLYFPSKATDDVELHFFPSKDQLETLRTLFFWKFSIRAKIKDSNGKIQQIIYSDNVHSNRLESPLIGVSTDLKIAEFSNNKIEKDITGEFWITSNSLLQPVITGNPQIKTNIAREFEFSLNTNLKVKFNVNPKNWENQNIDTYSELVAHFELKNADIHNSKLQETLKLFDDFLLLASFAARKKSVCFKWVYSNSKTQITKYLKDRFIPHNKLRRGESEKEELISSSHFEQFIDKSFNNFQSYHNVEALRRTLHFVIPKYGETLESEYISLFTAFEMIVLQFRKKKEMEYILDDDKFEDFRKEMEECFGKIDLSTYIEFDTDDLHKRKEIIGTKRQQLKSKFKGINRISLGGASRKFWKEYSVDLSDLWDVTGGDGDSLTEIRNKLVHGEHLNQEKELVLYHAKEHLRWVVERMILAILKVPMDLSHVSPKYLRLNTNSYLNWKEEKKKFLDLP